MKMRFLLTFVVVGALCLFIFKKILVEQQTTALSESPTRSMVKILKQPSSLKSQNTFQALVKSPEEIPAEDQYVNPENIRGAIAKIEEDLENRRAIQRLNDDTVEPKERALLGEQLKNLD